MCLFYLALVTALHSIGLSRKDVQVHLRVYAPYQPRKALIFFRPAGALQIEISAPMPDKAGAPLPGYLPAISLRRVQYPSNPHAGYCILILLV